MINFLLMTRLGKGVTGVFLIFVLIGIIWTHGNLNAQREQKERDLKNAIDTHERIDNADIHFTGPDDAREWLRNRGPR